MVQTPVSRRRFLKGSASAVAATAAPAILSSRARAQPKTLTISQWKHFVPSFDEWFSGTYVKEWGERNDTQVIVDYVALDDIGNRAQAEVAAKRGHDLFIFLIPHAAYEDYVIDHREIYEECRLRYGPASDFAIKSTFNPKIDKYYGFLVSYHPALTIYRKDLWDEVPWKPDTWEHVLAGGRWIKLAHNKPVGFSLAPEANSNQTMRAIMYSFGSSEQDSDANPALKSPATLDALKYVKSVYQEAMVEEVLTWDPASNNRFMLNGDGCLTLDTISIPRASESMGLPITKDLWLAKVPAGPVARAAPLVRAAQLRHLGVRPEHRGRQAISGRLHRQLARRLPGERLSRTRRPFRARCLIWRRWSARSGAAGGIRSARGGCDLDHRSRVSRLHQPGGERGFQQGVDFRQCLPRRRPAG